MLLGRPVVGKLSLYLLSMEPVLWSDPRLVPFSWDVVGGEFACVMDGSIRRCIVESLGLGVWVSFDVAAGVLFGIVCGVVAGVVVAGVV